MSLQSRNRERGKDAERAVAKLLGGKRIGILGSEDIEHPVFSIEVKSRLTFSACKWMNQAIANSPPHKTPVVVVHVAGDPFEKSYVIMQLDEWKRHVKNLQESTRCANSQEETVTNDRKQPR